MATLRRSLLGMATLLAVVQGSALSYPITDGLVGYWPAEGNADDLSPSANHGTLQGGATFAPGRLGQAFSLDGEDDWISSNQTFADDQSHTISAWVLWNGHTSTYYQEIVSWWDSLLFPVDSRMFLGTTWAPGQGPMRYGDDWVSVPVNLPTGEWVHVAATYDGATNDRQVYLGGYLVATSPSTAEASFELLAIGRQGNVDSAGEYWNGLIDEVALYNRVLSPSEIQALALVPEPATLTLLVLGGLGLLRRRLRHA